MDLDILVANVASRVCCLDSQEWACEEAAFFDFISLASFCVCAKVKNKLICHAEL